MTVAIIALSLVFILVTPVHIRIDGAMRVAGTISKELAIQIALWRIPLPVFRPLIKKKKKAGKQRASFSDVRTALRRLNAPLCLKLGIALPMERADHFAYLSALAMWIKPLAQLSLSVGSPGILGSCMVSLRLGRLAYAGGGYIMRRLTRRG